MFDRLRDELDRSLAANAVGVLCAAGEGGPQAQPVRYRARGLTIDCLLPGWCDLSYLLHENPRAVLIVLITGQEWLRCQGAVEHVPAPDWEALLPGEKPPTGRYQVFRIQPDRIERFDPEAGWGFRETLDL